MRLTCVTSRPFAAWALRSSPRSALFDLPTGALIVWCLAGVGLAVMVGRGRAGPKPA